METYEKQRKEYEQREERRIQRNLALAAEGVEFIDIKQAYIGEEVTVGAGTLIYPGVVLEGKTCIGKDCILGQNSRIVDSTIGDCCQIQQSVIMESQVGEETTVGPFAYIRPHCRVGSRCKVGDFVEMKNSSFGDGSKASHLTYVGDADVGSGVNLGCGVVFVNYDGKNKNRSTVEDQAFIGCNCNVVAPVTVAEKSYVAAGSTVTKNVPKDSLFLERSKSKVVPGWVSRRGLLDKKKK